MKCVCPKIQSYELSFRNFLDTFKKNLHVNKVYMVKLSDIGHNRNMIYTF